MIVRDEEEVLPRCLKSVQSVADELIVVDTGSKDNTVSIVRDFGARVFHFEWCEDWAAARNESLKHATGDWILQIDADEELSSESIPHLEDTISRASVLYYLLRCDNGPKCEGPRFVWIGRLFRRHPGLQYQRPYHEGVDGSVQGVIMAESRWQKEYAPNIVIRHYGYKAPSTSAKYDRGLRIMESYLKQNPNDSYMLTRLGIAYCGLGRHDEAEACLSKALKTDPECSHANYSLGVTLEELGRPEAAIDCYRRAIASDPHLAEARGNLGGIYIKKGMVNNAISELRRALTINSELISGRNNLGLAYISKGMYDEAIAELKKAIAIDTDLASAHMNLGMAYTKKGMLDDAVVEYEKALDIDPDYAKAHYNLAITYYKRGNYEKAIEHCDKANELGAEIHRQMLEWLQPYR